MVTLNIQSVPIVFQSTLEQTSLVELYTSEGCSSCPPAERWFSGLKTSPGIWKDFVPVAFHVNYWDSLGWPDSLARDAFTSRQRQYAALWKSDSVYTPGFVCNGREWRDWQDFVLPPKLPATKAGLLTVISAVTNHWQVCYVPAEAKDAKYEFHAVLLGCGLSSDVIAGENRGRHLNHDFAVLKMVTGPLEWKDGQWNADLSLLRDKLTVGQSAMAVWITRQGELEPLQACGGWLGADVISR